MVGAVKKRVTTTTSVSSSSTFVNLAVSSPATSTSAKMKFRPPPSSQLEGKRGTTKGTKPLPDPESIAEVFTRVVLHGCKRILFLEPKFRLTYYAVLLFFISLIGDYFPIPKSYFSNSDNIPNQYFVKLSWAWTLILTSTFVFLTTSVTCCGNRQLVLRHFSRMLLATIVWYIWTNLFSIIEESTGHCIFTKNSTSSSTMPVRDTVTVYSKSRKSCKSGGGKWTSFDISGHSFLLIWCVLFITEECKAIIGWDTIPNLIRNEEYKRKMRQNNGSASLVDGEIADTTISHLNQEEFETLKITYNQYNIWTKVSLIVLTGLTILWDVMLIATSCYFHVMIEKVIAGLLAVTIWFFTYKGLYKMDNLAVSPGLPGFGHFKYCTTTGFTSGNSKTYSYSSGGVSPSWPMQSAGPSSRIRPTLTGKDWNNSKDVPKFLGMPLKIQKNFGRAGLEDSNSNESN